MKLYVQQYSKKVTHLSQQGYGKKKNSISKRSLIVKYLDGNKRNAQGEVEHPGYPQDWYDHVVEQTGDHFKMIELEKE